MTSNETTAVLAEDLIVNPTLVLLQRRLSAPNYDGPGKWAIFDTSTRKSLLAVERLADFEQGRIATVLRLLLAYSAAPGLGDDADQELADVGLLVPGADDAHPSATFVARFQQSVFDYPFYDYSSPQAFREDRELMASYADQAPPPPSWTDRGTTSMDLPDVTWNDLPILQSKPFSLRHLAAVLRFAFGPIAEIQNLGSVMHYRRTSPSGGAKHPTEGWLNVATPWEGLAPGLYAYDCAHHALVAVDDPDLRFNDHTDGQPWSISVRSRVERPMWRYRDSRSFRAVLIDAGHVIETLNLLMGHFGVGVAVYHSGRPAHGAKWLREPEVAVVVPDIVVSAPPPETRRGAAAVPEPGPGIHGEESLLTNPAMYFTIESGRFHGHIVHPRITSFSADETDFAILTACILSHRGRPSRPGDRYTTPKAIIDTIKGATGDRIASLVQCGALLPAPVAEPLYSEIRRWAEHGWYQPALAWMEAANSRPLTTGTPNRARTFSAGCDLGNALRNRVTTRSFSNEPISRGTLMELVSEAFAVDSGLTGRVRCLAATFNVTGCEPDRLWRWDNDNMSLIEQGTTVTSADLVDLTIGQKWLRGSAAAIWFVTRIDADNPASYLTANVILGRMAQSVCVLGTDRGLGVFQTPAIEDRKFIARMDIGEDPDMIAYLVCVGRPRRENRAQK